MHSNVPWAKRAFDLILIALALPCIILVVSICSVSILLSDGFPILYRSKRRIYQDHSRVIVKFRTMRRNADKIANRNTVPISNTRFLNMAIDSPLYTNVGRWIERLMLTELPQIYHVVRGEMSLVGNRPLPENVIAALRQAYPTVESRFAIPAGLTGPVQLVGRDDITDADRLNVEAAYCQAVLGSYTMMLDIKILFWTVMVGIFPGCRFNAAQALRLVAPRSAVAGVRGEDRSLGKAQ